MRRQTLKIPPPLFRAWWTRGFFPVLAKRLRPSLLRVGLAIGAAALVVATFGVPPALAAEILGVRGPTRLQVGDQNRSYGVELACLEVAAADAPQAIEWLRRHGTRGARVNLRPVGEHDGWLVARVSLLKDGLDLGEALVAEGLATLSACPADGAVS